MIDKKTLIINDPLGTPHRMPSLMKYIHWAIFLKRAHHEFVLIQTALFCDLIFLEINTLRAFTF